MDRQFFQLSAIIVVSMLILSSYRSHTTEPISVSPPSKVDIDNAARLMDNKTEVPDNWKPFINPSFSEFWTEGHTKADSGFILFARNPTPENAKLWLIRMENKRKMLLTMQGLIDQVYPELVSSGEIVDYYNLVSAVSKNSPKPALQNIKLASDITLYFLFSPTCPHCKSQAEILKNVSSHVVPLQVSGGELLHFKGFKHTEWADNETKNKYVKGKVPVILVYNQSSQKIAKLSGVKRLLEIKETADYVSK